MSSDWANAGLNGAANNIFANIGARRWGIVESDGTPFEETIANATDARFPNAPPPGTFNSYADVQRAIRSYLPPETEALINARFEPALPDPSAAFFTDPIVGLTTTRSFVAEGYEAELVGNPARGWRVSLNVGQQETVTSNTAPVLAEVAVAAREGMMRENIWGLQIDPGNNSNPTFGSSLNNGTFLPLEAAQARDGTVSLEQREWRVNLATNYDFLEGALKGFGLGGASRSVMSSLRSSEQLREKCGLVARGRNRAGEKGLNVKQLGPLRIALARIDLAKHRFSTFHVPKRLRSFGDWLC
jgi:hypothetical protein